MYGSPSNPNKGFNLFQVTDSRGVETILYDPLDRVTSNTKPTGENLVHTYDSRGNRLTTTLNFRPSAGLSPIQQIWTYDNLNRNVTAQDFAGNVKILNFDPGSRLTNELLPNGIRTDYSYDSANRLTSIINKKVASDSVITQAIYALDGVGNRISKTDTSGTRNYGYDRTYQLIQVQTALAAIQESSSVKVKAGREKIISYVYDNAGNRQSKTTTFTGGVPDEVLNYSYNGANEMMNAGGVAQTFDLNGNLIASGSETLTWDFRNRLVGVQEAGKEDWGARYDYRNRIAERVVGAESFVMVYDFDGQLLAEVGSSGTAEKIHSYDNIGLMTSTGLNGQIFPTYDGIGSVVSYSDKGGHPVSFENFDAFGGNSNIDEHFKFTGRFGGYSDRRLGKTLHWNRWQASSAGNWLNRDPTGVEGGINLYQYVSNNPLRMIDPTGLEPCCPEADVKACIAKGRKQATRFKNLVNWAFNGLCKKMVGPMPYEHLQKARSSRWKALKKCQTNYLNLRSQLAPKLAEQQEACRSCEDTDFPSISLNFFDPISGGNIEFDLKNDTVGVFNPFDYLIKSFAF